MKTYPHLIPNLDSLPPTPAGFALWGHGALESPCFSPSEDVAVFDASLVRQCWVFGARGIDHSVFYALRVGSAVYAANLKALDRRSRLGKPTMTAEIVTDSVTGKKFQRITITLPIAIASYGKHHGDEDYNPEDL